MNIFIRLKIAQEIVANNFLGMLFALLALITLCAHICIIGLTSLSFFEAWPIFIIELVLIFLSINLFNQASRWKEIILEAKPNQSIKEPT